MSVGRVADRDGICGWRGGAGWRMKLIAYQALLSNPQSVALVRARTREVERVGGRVHMAPPSTVGMVAVILELPEGIPPDRFFPGIPFYPM